MTQLTSETIHHIEKNNSTLKKLRFGNFFFSGELGMVRPTNQEIDLAELGNNIGKNHHLTMYYRNNYFWPPQVVYPC